MIHGFLILLICLLLGEFLVAWMEVPIPGSVVGMVVLLAGLMMNGGVPEGLRLTSEGLLKALPLLLVPAGVGLMKHFGVLSLHWEGLLFALFFSTLVTMLVVACLLKVFSPSDSGGE
ncbi:MAG: CidA/LrgA family protein [Neptuniibacter sp.]